MLVVANGQKDTLSGYSRLTNIMLLPRTDAEIVSLEGHGEINIEGYYFRSKSVKNLSPCVIFLHGWGGDASSILPDETPFLVSKNSYVMLVPTLRGFGTSGGTDDCGLKQPDDILNLISWVKKQPDVDSNKIALVGYSQGAQVALLATAKDFNSIRAVVSISGVTDVRRWGETTTHTAIPNYVSRVCESGRKRSPVDYSHDINVPVLLIHGDNDQRVPTEQSEMMHNKLIEEGKQSEIKMLKGANHYLTNENWDQINCWIDSFLTRIFYPTTC